MGKRREGREAAVQFLFCSDINSELGPADIDGFFTSSDPELQRAMAHYRERGFEPPDRTISNLRELDELLAAPARDE